MDSLATDPTDGFAQQVLLAEQAAQAGRLDDCLRLTEPLRAGLSAAAPIWARRARLVRLNALHRTGALELLLTEGRDALPSLRQWPATEGLFEVLRWMAGAGAETAQYSTALLCAQECHAIAIAGEHKGRQALALNAIACCLERMGDPWQAERLMTDGLALARQAGPGMELFILLNNLCALMIGRFYLLRDARTMEEAREPLHQALPAIEEALQLTQAMPDAFPRVFVRGNLGEVLTHLGRLDEARQHLAQAQEEAAARGFHAQSWRIRCSMGELQLALGAPREAWQTLSEVLGHADSGFPLATRLRLHHALSQAAAQLHRDVEALQHLQTYLRLERSRSVAQLHAQSQLFVTRLEAEQERLEARRQRQRAAELELDARRDPLTGVGNRRELDQRLPVLLAEAQAQGSTLVLAMLDIDHFKQVNDSFGHGVGDQVLEILGRLLREATRTQDMVTRVGGEEFLVALSGTEPEAAREAFERLRRTAETHAWGTLAPGLRVTLSIGIASTPPYEAGALLAAADQALYRAKGEGRNRIMAD
ncbi:MAG: GGDEF domain-containing protein [Rubrivivax sp.]|nr:GGDEF domain-containing protein [Rubrivivax sp.]